MLLPFFNSHQRLKVHHSLQMDNAPCHSSWYTKQFLIQNRIYHFKTPAQSPDLNPIELVWHDLKDYISRVIKPNNKHELINGIKFFWNTHVTVDYCNKKINHLYKVLRQIKNLEGKETGM